jgi:scyllo-inositol 2-dehydrogenase (NADP+)
MHNEAGRAPRLVVVGYGRWGRECHSYLISTTPGLELYGVLSRDPEKRARAEADRHCRTFASFDEVLEDPAVDAVVLATPNHSHAKLAIEALRAGKHVVSDKVMCLSLKDCDAMIRASQESKRLLTVFQNRRLDGDFLTLQQLLAEGRLGELRWLELAWQGFGIWGGWRGKREKGGGKIFDLGPHLLDQALLLFPEPVHSVYCRLHHDLPEVDVESEALIVLSFVGGRTAVLDMSSLAAIHKPRFYARGTLGSFQKFGLDPQEKAQAAGDIDAAVECASNYGVLKTRTTEEVVPTLPGRWRGYYENLRDCLRGQAEPMVTLPEQRRLMQVMDAIWESGTSGQVVQLHDDIEQ